MNEKIEKTVELQISYNKFLNNHIAPMALGIRLGED